MRKVLLLLAVLIVPAVASAQYPPPPPAPPHPDRYYDNRFELTPFVGYTWGGTIYADTTDVFRQNVDAESSANFGLNFGIPIGYSSLKLELMVNHQSTHLGQGGALFEPNNQVANFDVTYYQAGLQIPFAMSRTATPYLVMSLGGATLNPQVSGATSSTRFSGSFGGGVKFPINYMFAIRVEGRGYFTDVGNGNNHHDCFDCSNSHAFTQGQVNMGFVFSF